MGNTKKLEWEQVGRVSRGPMMFWETLYRARCNHGWLLRYLFFGGRDKSGSSLTWIPDPEGEWTLSSKKAPSEIISSTRTPNDYEVIRRFDIEPGSVLTLAAGTRNMFWTDVVFVPKGKHQPESEYVEIGDGSYVLGSWGENLDDLDF